MSVVDDRLSIGSIIYQYVTDTIPPKPKYYVIIGITSDSIALGTVYINTDINPKVFTTQKLKDLHIPIKVNENPFLDYDSFIDCSFIHQKETANVKACIESSDERYGYIATLDPNTFAMVIETLRNAHTISPIIKKKYL